MYKEIHTFRRQPFQELTGMDFVAFEALELTHRPPVTWQLAKNRNCSAPG